MLIVKKCRQTIESQQAKLQVWWQQGYTDELVRAWTVLEKQRRTVSQVQERVNFKI